MFNQTLLYHLSCSGTALTDEARVTEGKAVPTTAATAERVPNPAQ